MKKFLKITAVIILSLLIFFVGTFKYRQYQANQVLIPKNATSIIKISVDEIYKSLAENMIGHPAYYFKKSKHNSANAKIDQFDHGLKIPASIYLYNIESQPKTTLFTRLEIKDSTSLNRFLKQTLKFTALKAGKTTFWKPQLGNVIIAQQGKQIAIAFSAQSITLEPTLLDLLKVKNLEPLKNHPLGKIADQTDHFAMATHDHQSTLNFLNGKMEWNSEIKTKLYHDNKQYANPIFNKESTVQFWLNGDVSSLITKDIHFKNVMLKKDSLIKYIRGYLDFEWTGSIKQKDSIISYEYNDDFEKVETVKVVDQDIPNATLTIDANAIQLKNYLAHNKLINPQDHHINKTVFPLYKVKVSANAKQLIFSTGEPTENRPAYTNSEEFFGLHINFVKINKEMNIPKLSSYAKKLKYLEVKGKSTARNKIQLNGSLVFGNEAINSLYQLLSSFQNSVR